MGPHGNSAEGAEVIGFGVFRELCSGPLAGGESLVVDGLDEIGGAAIGDPERYAGSLPLGLNAFEYCARGRILPDIREISEACT